MIVLHFSNSAIQLCSLRGLGARTDLRLLLPFSSLFFPELLSIVLLEGVFTSDYVGGELVAVFATVTTDVAL